MNRPSLHLVSDLTFTLEGPDGSSEGRIDALGSHITVSSTDPVAAMNAAFGSSLGGSAAPAALADFLAEVGLTVDVVGPRGSVLTAGAGVHSAVGSLIGGTSHLRLGRPRAVLPLVASRLTPSPRTRRRLLLGVGGAAIVLAVGRAVRHRATD